jgi:hypothetical protein
MKHAVGIHFQYMKDEGRLLNFLLSLKRPFAAFIVPELLVDNLKSDDIRIYGNIHPAENHYPDWAKAFFKEHKHNPDIAWVQEGYLHCCGKCFKKREENINDGDGNWPDPHHEHVCVSDRTSQSFDKQHYVINRGRDLIFNETGIEKIFAYCPPNHLGNANTINAARINGIENYIVRNGFDYLTNGLIILLAYRRRHSIIIPESIIGEGKKSPLIGAYYDRLADGRQNLDKFLDFFDASVPIAEIIKNLGQKSKKHWLSEKLVYNYKKLRDFKKMLNPQQHNPGN